MLSEATKLLIAAVSLVYWKKAAISAIFDTLKTDLSNSKMETLFQHATPAVLYLINNLIYFTIIPHATPILLQVCMLMKLPATAILHHFMIKKQHNMHAWISLAFLCVGIIFNLPSKSQPTSEHMSVRWYIAPIAGFFIAFFSALASIKTEKLTKIGDFWASQICSYSLGLFFAIVPGHHSRDRGSREFLDRSSSVGSCDFSNRTTSGCSSTREGQHLKIIGIAASLITIAISQYIFLPELRPFTITDSKICGGGIFCITTWTCNYCSKEPWSHHGSRYLPISERQDEEATNEAAPIYDISGGLRSAFSLRMQRRS